jgi:hypothetical protein
LFSKMWGEYSTKISKTQKKKELTL